MFKRKSKYDQQLSMLTTLGYTNKKFNKKKLKEYKGDANKVIADYIKSSKHSKQLSQSSTPYFNNNTIKPQKQPSLPSFDEEQETISGPPKHAQFVDKGYSQELVVDKPKKNISTLDIVGGNIDVTRARTGTAQRKRVPSKNPHMTAINVIKAFFQHQRLNELQPPINAESLENLSPILEDIILASSSIPKYVISLFRNCCDNLFGVLNIDFNLLNEDYLYIKTVFVHSAENNSSIKFDRLMNLIQNAKVSTLQISNVHLKEESFDCIINYIANDDNYDAENYLQNSVNQMIVHRKSGMKYNEIYEIYYEQFKVCGWEMSWNADDETVVITLNFHASWEYVYDEDYDDEQEDDVEHKQSDEVAAIAATVDIAMPSSPPPKTTQLANNNNEDDEYEYYYEEYDDVKTTDNNNNTSLMPPVVPSSVTTAAVETPSAEHNENADDDGYEYYYEDEEAADTTTAAVVKPSSAPKVVVEPAVTATATATMTTAITAATAVQMSPSPGLAGLMGGLPPPDSSDDDDSDDNKEDIHKQEFLRRVLSKKDYSGTMLFNGLLTEIIDAMYPINVKKGQCILKETEYGQNYDLKFFVIEYGVFNLYQQGKKLGIELFSEQTFGETHLIYNTTQFVTIRAVTNKGLVWALNRSVYYQISWHYFHQPFVNRIEAKLNALSIITTLGVGSFGRVELVRDPMTKKTYSLKKISKNRIIQNRQQQHIMNERSVLAVINNNFCCRLYATYQDSHYLYFLMEPLLGGELFSLLRFNKKFSEKIARFYVGCIVLAFDHLHSRNIIYRDIKPENIMLASSGYVKLVDFGLSKKRNNSFTCCGTPEYLAPEIIQNFWQGFEVDFWGLGILLYEMITGEPPFDSYEQILGASVAVPESDNPSKPYSKELIHLIQNLLIKHPYQRLGTSANQRKGINEIYQHRWFKAKMDWNALRAQRFQPPYKPDIEDDEDCSNFDDVPDDEDANDPTVQNLYDDPSLYQWCQYF